MLTLRDFPDELIREAGTETHTNRKWSAIETVNQGENSFKHKDIVGVTVVERQVTGAQQRQSVEWIRPEGEERRMLTHSEVRRTEEHARQARAVEI